ncbi:MAG TPA: FkbM family methyltransferase [Chitinophagaceae bacterium]|nr:FkbM family methyltransferase [Chitinophagaceae bacterium]
MIEEIIRRIVREELDRKNYHVPFAVYMGEGVVLTRSFYDVLYLISGFDCTMTPHFIMDGVYESELTKYLLNNVKENSVFVDVGANFGYYSCMMAKRISAARGGKVYAFEPNKNAFLLLQKNVMINWLDGNSISLHGVALSDVQEEVQFKNYKYRFGGSQLYTYEENAEEINTAEIVKVSARTMDSYFPNGAKVDFLKIDVEGAEIKVLKGAEQTINNNPNIRIILEWDNELLKGHGTNSSALIEFLEIKKLRPFKLDWHDGSTSEISFDYLLSTSDHLCGVLFEGNGQIS